MDSKGCTRTKKDLIEKVADVTGQSRSAVKRTIQVAFDHIVDELAEGNRLEFRDFGVFVAKFRPGRIAQNPKTLEPVYVPPRRTVKFKPSRSMRDRLKIECESPSASEEARDALKAHDALHMKKPIEVSAPVSAPVSIQESVQESVQVSDGDPSQTPTEARTGLPTGVRVKPSFQTPAQPSIEASNASI